MRSSARTDALLLVLLAWVHRVLFLVSNRDRAWGFSIFYEGDSETFFDYARHILDRQPYDGGVPFHPPGFPVLLAGLHTVIGDGAGTAATDVAHLTVKVLLALISSVAVGLLYTIVRAYLGRVAAWASALVLTYSFAHYVVSVSPVTEGVYTTMLMLALAIWTIRLPHRLAAGDGSHRHVVAWSALLGGVLGLMALVRAEAVLFGVCVIGVGVIGAIGRNAATRRAYTGGRTRTADGSRALRRAANRGSSGAQPVHRGSWHALLPWGIAMLAAVAVIAPWTIRNHTRLTDVNRTLGPRLAEPLPTFVPITIYGPLNLALANHEGADGTFSRSLLAASRGASTLDLQNPDHLAVVLHGHERAWAFARSNPGEFVQLVAAKWRLTLGVLRLGWTQWDWPGGLDGFRRPVDMFVPTTSAGMWLSVPLIVVGLIGWLRAPGASRRWGLVVLMTTGYVFIVTGAFFGYARAAVVLVPLWSSALASTLVAAGTWLSARWPRAPRARTIAVAVIVSMLFLDGYGSSTNRNFDATGTMQPGATHLDPHAVMYLRAKRN